MFALDSQALIFECVIDKDKDKLDKDEDVEEKDKEMKFQSKHNDKLIQTPIPKTQTKPISTTSPDVLTNVSPDVLPRVSPKVLPNVLSDVFIIFGSTGSVGSSFCHHCQKMQKKYIPLSRKDINVSTCTPMYVRHMMNQLWKHHEDLKSSNVYVINAVACKSNETKDIHFLWKINSMFPWILHQLKDEFGFHLIQFSPAIMFNPLSSIDMGFCEYEGDAKLDANSKKSIECLWNVTNHYAMSKRYAEELISESPTHRRETNNENVWCDQRLDQNTKENNDNNDHKHSQHHSDTRSFQTWILRCSLITDFTIQQIREMCNPSNVKQNCVNVDTHLFLNAITDIQLCQTTFRILSEFKKNESLRMVSEKFKIGPIESPLSMPRIPPLTPLTPTLPTPTLIPIFNASSTTVPIQTNLRIRHIFSPRRYSHAEIWSLIVSINKLPLKLNFTKNTLGKSLNYCLQSEFNDSKQWLEDIPELKVQLLEKLKADSNVQ